MGAWQLQQDISQSQSPWLPLPAGLCGAAATELSPKSAGWWWWTSFSYSFCSSLSTVSLTTCSLNWKEIKAVRNVFHPLRLKSWVTLSQGSQCVSNHRLFHRLFHNHFPLPQHILHKILQIPYSSERTLILENTNPELLRVQVKNHIFVPTILFFFHKLAWREGNSSPKQFPQLPNPSGLSTLKFWVAYQWCSKHNHELPLFLVCINRWQRKGDSREKSLKINTHSFKNLLANEFFAVISNCFPVIKILCCLLAAQNKLTSTS